MKRGFGTGRPLTPMRPSSTDWGRGRPGLPDWGVPGRLAGKPSGPIHVDWHRISAGAAVLPPRDWDRPGPRPPEIVSML